LAEAQINGTTTRIRIDMRAAFDQKRHRLETVGLGGFSALDSTFPPVGFR
jgi:hypothetical protein